MPLEINTYLHAKHGKGLFHRSVGILALAPIVDRVRLCRRGNNHEQPQYLVEGAAIFCIMRDERFQRLIALSEQVVEKRGRDSRGPGPSFWQLEAFGGLIRCYKCLNLLDRQASRLFSHG